MGFIKKQWHRVVAFVLALTMCMSSVPTLTVAAEETEPTVYFQILDEQGNELPANASLSYGDVFQLKMYLKENCGAQMMQLPVPYNTDLIQNIDIYDTEEEIYSECYKDAIFDDITINPVQDGNTAFYDTMKVRGSEITQGGLLATFRFEVVSKKGGEISFSVDQNHYRFSFVDKTNTPVPFTSSTAGFTIADTREDLQKATVDLSGSSFPYTGAAIEPEVSSVTINGETIPAEDYTVSYENNTDVTTQARVILTAAETSGTVKGSGTGTFAITPKDGSGFTVETKNVPYTGEPVNPVLSVKDGDKTLELNKDYTVESTDVNAGDAKATITYCGNYTGTQEVSYKITQVKQEGTLTIVGLPNAAVKFSVGQKYTLTAEGGAGTGAVTWSVSDDSPATVQKTGDAQAELMVQGVGTIRVTAEKAEDVNHENAIQGTAELTVEKGDGAAAVSMEGWTYGESPRTPTVTSSTHDAGEAEFLYKAKDAQDSAYSSTVPENAGEYTVKAELAANDNYNAVSATADFVISKAVIDTSSVTWVPEQENMVYDGTVKSMKLSGLPELVAAELTGDSATGAGEYRAVAKLSPKGDAAENYTISKSEVSRTWSIAQAVVTITPVNKTVRVNTTLPQLSCVVTGMLEKDRLITEPTLTTNADVSVVGNYQISANGADAGPNYTIVYQTGTLYVVDKEPQVLKFADTQVQKTYGDADFVMAAEHSKGDGALSYRSSNETVATVDAASGKVTIVGAGSTTIIAAAEATQDYAEASASYALTVKAKQITPEIQLSRNEFTYNGQNHEPQVSVFDAAAEVSPEQYTVTYQNNVNAGTATVSVVMKGNYTGSNTRMFTISPAQIDVRGVTLETPKDAVYHGEAYVVQVKDLPEHVLVVEWQNQKAVAAGNYTTSVTLETDSTNYSLKGSETLSADWQIAKAAAVVTALDKIVRVGAAVPDLTAPEAGVDYTVTGLYGNDSINGITMRADGVTTEEENDFDLVISGPAETENYAVTYENAKIHVRNKLISTVTVDHEVSKTFGDADFEIHATTNSDGELSFASDDESVVKVDAATGKVSIVGSGAANIVVKSAETADYAEGSAACRVTVDKKAVTPEIVIQEECVYTGAAQEPVLLVKVDGTEVQGYQAEYGDNLQAGTAWVKVTLEEKNYTGTARKEFTILPRDLTGKAVVGAIPDRTYNGKTQTPAIVVRDGETTLMAAVDYDVRYQNNVNAGDASCVITFKGNYAGTAEAAFKILPKDASTAEVAAIPSQTYSSATLTPVPVITLNGTALVADRDFKVAYTDNTKVGTAKVQITFVNNYSGSTQTSFQIEPKDLTETVQIETIPDQYYTGAAVLPQLKVRDGSIVLSEGTDYTVAYGDNNINVNDSPVSGVLTFVGNYKGHAEVSFRIVPAPLDVDSVQVRWAQPIYETMTNPDAVAATITGNITFQGEPVTGVFTWEEGTKFTAEKKEYTWVFTPDDAYHGNFAQAKGTVELSVIATKPIVGTSDRVISMDASVSVPDGLTNVYVNVDDMFGKMTATMSDATTDNSVFYEVDLWQKTGDSWNKVSAREFPAEGITIVMPYPEGTNSAEFDFQAAHLFTTTMNGHRAGEIENPIVVALPEGLQMKVNGLSPIALSWTRKQTPANNGNSGGSAGNEEHGEICPACGKAELKNGVCASCGYGSTVTSTRVTIPQTGDSSNLPLLAVLCIVAGLGFAVFARKKRKNQ